MSRGIKLTTGETIGAWSLNMLGGEMDGEEMGEGPADPEGDRVDGDVDAPLTSRDAGDAASHEDDTEDFARKMMEELYYKRLKAKMKAEQAASKQAKPNRTTHPDQPSPEAAAAHPAVAGVETAAASASDPPSPRGPPREERESPDRRRRRDKVVNRLGS